MSVLEHFRSRFSSPDAFQSHGQEYQLAPFRFARIPGLSEMLLVNELGEFHYLSEDVLQRFCDGRLSCEEEAYLDLRSKHFLLDEHAASYWPYAVSQYRTRKGFLSGGPSLHIFVVTLRCHHTCPYCQVSRQTTDMLSFDMSRGTIDAAVERIFESPSNDLKIEFQGGEPLLAFESAQSWSRSKLETPARSEILNM